jgi:dihydrodipicolinate synthase/N-acetylneuraminate lyase
MSNMTLLCRSATTFSKNGDLDEDAFRQFLQRFVDAKIGVYLASGGSGEGHALTWDELGRIYRIGVEVCKGKVPVNSNQPEQHTAQASLAHAQLAVNAGVDVVNIYGPERRHGFRATDAEYIAYFDRILHEIRHPVALCPNPITGHAPEPSVIASICHKYSQVVAVNLSGQSGDLYFLNLRDALKRQVDIYVPYPGSLNTLEMGATGLLGAEANFIPKTFRCYIDLYEARKFDDLSRVYADIRRVTQFVAQWPSSTPRWIKMAMKAFKLPGWEGGVREPYLMPDDAEFQKFTLGALKLDVPEINEMARAAGLGLAN